MAELSHFDGQGRAVMVDVGAKAVTSRRAVAAGRVVMSPTTLERIRDGAASKGDVLGVARIAGIMAAKRTADLIPLCHPLGLDSVTIDFVLDEPSHAVEIRAVCSVTGRTGIEMEAMTAVSVAALTVYDMCKAVDRSMRIDAVRLVRKEGGKSGVFEQA